MSNQWLGICLGLILFFVDCESSFNLEQLIDDNGIGKEIGNELLSSRLSSYYTATLSGNVAVIRDINYITEYELQEIIEEEINGLSMNNNSNNLIPNGTKLNKVIVIDNGLLLDFSEEFLNYGGSQWERDLVNSILGVAFSHEQINKVSIAVNGEVINLVEGSIINGYTREKWEREK